MLLAQGQGSSKTLELLFHDFPTEAKLMDLIMVTSTVLSRTLEKKDIDRWLENFSGEVFDVKYERLLALWLLSHFTFYNHDEIVHLCKIAYLELVHTVLAKGNSNVEASKRIERFFKRSQIISPEQVGGSGGFIAYFFRQINDLPQENFGTTLEEACAKSDNIIVIDDVTLTEGNAGQMFRFWKQCKAEHPKHKFFLVTLIAYHKALEILEREFKVNTIAAIKLDARDKCFWTESDLFSPYPNLISIGKRFAKHYGRKAATVNGLGYGNGQFTFGYFYNTPNNTLPIFWGRKDGWSPVINRYDKNFGTKVYTPDERFI